MISRVYLFGLDLIDDDQKELDKDAEAMKLGFIRMIPFYGSIVSAVLAGGLDRHDGTMFPALESDRPF